MVALSKLTTNRTEIQKPRWVQVETQAGGNFEIEVSGYSAAYRQELFLAQRDRATDLNRALRPGARLYTAETLPPAEFDRINGKLIGTHCVHDVRDLTHDDGTPVTVEEFREIIADPETGGGLLWLTNRAVDSIYARKAEVEAEAEGN